MTGQSRSTMLLAVALIVQPVPALARGSFGNADPPWNREHLDRLPEEVQRAARRLCPNEPHAAHYFATYSENSKFINLHFEQFSCQANRHLCNASGCLHQVYVLRGRHYQLLRSFYGPPND
jgi:hypothetical protein